MKFDLRKAFPHPVLRHGSNDYPDAEFQAEISLERNKGTSHIQLCAHFSLSEDDILQQMENDAACFVLILECSMTHVRLALRTTAETLSKDIPAGQLRGAVELRPLVVATRVISDFRAKGWHKDFANMPSMTIGPGTVLAADDPKTYYIDNAEEAPIGSIFTTTSVDNAQEGRWRCNLHADRIEIQLSSNDHQRLTTAREALRDKADGAYLMNGIYLPALYHVLTEADSDAESYEDYRWFRSLEARLSEHNLQPLGTKGASRLEDAQQLLKNPFRSMPCLIDEAAG